MDDFCAIIRCEIQSNLTESKIFSVNQFPSHPRKQPFWYIGLISDRRIDAWLVGDRVWSQPLTKRGTWREKGFYRGSVRAGTVNLVLIWWDYYKEIAFEPEQQVRGWSLSEASGILSFDELEKASYKAGEPTHQ